MRPATYVDALAVKLRMSPRDKARYEPMIVISCGHELQLTPKHGGAIHVVLPADRVVAMVERKKDNKLLVQLQSSSISLKLLCTSREAQVKWVQALTPRPSYPVDGPLLLLVDYAATPTHMAMLDRVKSVSSDVESLSSSNPSTPSMFKSPSREQIHARRLTLTPVAATDSPRRLNDSPRPAPQPHTSAPHLPLSVRVSSV